MTPKTKQWIEDLEKRAFDIWENGQTGELKGIELHPSYSTEVVLGSLAQKKALFRRNKDYIDLLKDFYSKSTLETKSKKP